MTASPQEVERAAALLRGGGVVVFPTETVYGLGASALDAAAVERIFAIKGRPRSSPLIVHVASAAEAPQWSSAWNSAAQKLAERFWPGPLTIVVPKNPRIVALVTAGLETVGLRVPAHPVAQALLQAAAIPVCAPSANRFMALSPTRAAHARRSLGDGPDLILDGGPAAVGIESTVVSVAGQQPVLLRPGMISLPELQDVLGPLAQAGVTQGAHPAPGMHARHYAPRTRLVTAASGDAPPAGAGVLLALSAELWPGVRTVRLPADPAGYAASLYDCLHEFDEGGWEWIAVEMPPDSPEWAGVRDRIVRASH